MGDDNMANRYNENENFVSPGSAIVHQPRASPEIIRIDVDERPTDIISWRTSDPSRDSVGAKDRADGVNLRFKPMLIINMTLSIFGTIVFVYTVPAALIGQTIDAILVFLFTLSASSLVAIVFLNTQDYRHSQAGVERLKIKSVMSLHQARQNDLHELRKQALTAQVRMMEKSYEAQAIDPEKIRISQDRK